MSGSLVLLHLAGAVALLLWATRMIRTGVERAYGDILKRRLRGAMESPLLATGLGVLLAIALQSSTAVTLLVGSFAGSGIVTGLSGILAVRGAEVGSALVVKILTYDLSLLVPVLLLAGTAIFLSTERREWRQAGRILVGLGLMLLSLQLMEEATAPLRQSELLPVIVRYLSGDALTSYLLAALITWLFHSSIAAVLLLATLAGKGIIGPDLVIVMTLGINLGSSVIAPFLTRNAEPAARVVPLGNLMMRGAGSLVLLILFMTAEPPLTFLGEGADRVVNGHILFNLIILVAGIPLSRLVHKATQAIVARSGPAEETPLADTQVSALHAEALTSPRLALANATREVLRACETVELMLTRIIELYENADKQQIADLAAIDDRLDRRHREIKLYLAKLAGHDLDEADALRCQELLDACIKLEQVGDIITGSMLGHVRKKMQRHLAFTPQGFEEIASFHASVLANARLAFNVLVSRDRETAQEIVQEKDSLRLRERKASAQHFARLRQGMPESVETSAIHLDTIRDLKQINSLLASLAYPVLQEHGLLRDSRLKAE